MAGAIGLNYDEMEAELQRLEGLANEFENTTNSMTTCVNTLCDNSTWKSEATESYREDYEKLTANFGNTLDVVRSMIQDNRHFIQDMQAADSAHSTSRVQV